MGHAYYAAVSMHLSWAKETGIIRANWRRIGERAGSRCLRCKVVRCLVGSTPRSVQHVYGAGKAGMLRMRTLDECGSLFLQATGERGTRSTLARHIRTHEDEVHKAKNVALAHIRPSSRILLAGEEPVSPDNHLCVQ